MNQDIKDNAIKEIGNNVGEVIDLCQTELCRNRDIESRQRVRAHICLFIYDRDRK